jgi:hypothetical protein
MTSAVWVLFAVIVYPSNTATSFTYEFTSRAACETAKESVRQKLSGGKFILLTCEKK